MSTKTAPAASTADREIVITRVFDAPRELVWDAWTDLKHVGNWWGPRGFTTTTHSREFREGGSWRYMMHGPDGRDYPNRVTYLEIERPARLVYNQGGEEDYKDIHFQATVTFEDVGGKTRVTMRSVFPSVAERDRVVREYGAVQGGIQHLGRLAEHLANSGSKQRPVLTLALPSDREIMLSRSFEAPRQLVFEAFTRPEFLTQWWGLRGSSLAVCEVDLKPGGAWRFVLRGPDGSEHPFKGVFREITPPEKLVRTMIYDVPMARDHEAVETLVFDEEDGKTILTNTVLHKTMEGRDGHLHSGMEPGAAETLDRLEELLQKLA
jgi:uncharacterized protein YndB with AHSA1/START domain